MIHRLLRLASERHTAAAIRWADRLTAARGFAADCADDLGDTIFAIEQSLRFHDAEHHRRQRKAERAVAFIVAEMRSNVDAEAKRRRMAN